MSYVACNVDLVEVCNVLSLLGIRSFCMTIECKKKRSGDRLVI